MRLQSGTKVPHFEIHGLDGAQFNREFFAGKKLWIILGRFVACPFCSLRLQEVIARWPTIEKTGIEVLVVFPSKPKRVQRFVDKYQPKFHVAADPEKTIFHQFGSETSWVGELKTVANVPKVFRAIASTKMNPFAVDDAPHRMPSEYLISEDGTLHEAYYGGELDDGFKIQHVATWAGASSDGA